MPKSRQKAEGEKGGAVGTVRARTGRRGIHSPLAKKKCVSVMKSIVRVKNI